MDNSLITYASVFVHPTFPSSRFKGFDFSTPSERLVESPFKFPTAADANEYRSQQFNFTATIPSDAVFGPKEYFLRSDPNKISELEIAEAFTQRHVSDPFNEIDPRTLQLLRAKRGLAVRVNPNRIELKDSKPDLYYKRVGDGPGLDGSYGSMNQQTIKEILILSDPTIAWSSDLSVNFSRSDVVATGFIKVSKLQTQPALLLSYSGEDRLYSFIAEGLTHVPGCGPAAGSKLFVASESLLYNLLPFLQKQDGNEAVPVVCDFQTHPSTVGGADFSESFYLREIF